MDIELYICEGKPTDTSSVYLPDFTHHAHNDLSFPYKWATIQELKNQGYELVKTIDFTQRHNVEDKSQPVEKYILIFLKS
jgi:hypothetical protein